MASQEIWAEYWEFFKHCKGMWFVLIGVVFAFLLLLFLVLYPTSSVTTPYMGVIL